MSRYPYSYLMTKNKFEKSLCEECGQPLFLSKEECRNFIESKMKQGYVVCGCCGAKKTIDRDKNQ